MPNFQLSNNISTYSFDTTGGVSMGAAVAGTWTTNAANQIVANVADGAIAFDVGWVFNNQNQLTIQSNGAEVFNFSTGLRNSFTTRNADLIVQPDRLGAFTFALHGDWALTADHNLSFTINGLTSTLSGFVSDPIGRFIFHFANLDNILQTNVLGFVGSWQNRMDGNGTPLLDFHYQTPSGENVFELPLPPAINRNSNQLAYTYSKGNKNLSIDFQGTLTIGPNFDITYVVQPQATSSGEQMVASSTLAFSATLGTGNVHGDLQLTAGASTWSVGGQYQGVLGKTSLQVGFTFTQTFGSAGNTITRTAAFGGTLAFNGGQVQWMFSSTGTTVELAVGVDIKLGQVQLDARLNLPLGDGQASGVTFLLGVSF